MNEAEQTIESLRKEKQALEDTLLDEKSHAPSGSIDRADSKRRASGVRHSQRTSPLVLELEEPESSDTSTPQAPADAKLHAMRASAAGSSRPSTSRSLSAVLDDCITQLVVYHDARRQVLGILKDKKDAEQSKDEAVKRVSALEMQKLRQSLSVRESISDVATSIRAINDKLAAESRSLDELARLTKLKDRAERKLQRLRKQEAADAFLDPDAQQELTDLVELVQDLDSHIAFQDAELAVARNDLALIKTRSHAADASPLDALARGIVEQLTRAASRTDATELTEFVKRVLEEVRLLM